MKIRIKRISPTSLALTLGAIYFAIGCVASIMGLLALGTGMNMTFKSWINVSGTGSISAFMILLNPFISAIGGCITGFLIAWIYNFISRHTGGVAIETEESQSFF